MDIRLIAYERITVKKIAPFAFALLLSAGMLCGCAANGVDAQNDDKPQVEQNAEFQAELEAMHEANTLENIFDVHVLMNCTTETWEFEDGAEVWQGVAKECFSSAGSGFSYYSESTDAEGSFIVADSYSDDTTPVALYSYNRDGDLGLRVFPAGEFAGYLSAQWPPSDVVAEGDRDTFETVLSIEEDAELATTVITVEMDLRAVRIETVYFIDTPSGLITGIEQTTYDSETGEKTLVERSNVWYDDPIERADSAYAKVRDAKDTCTLTVVFNPGEDDEETQTLTVAKGTHISAAGQDCFYDVYADAECSELIEQIPADEDEVTVYAKRVA